MLATPVLVGALGRIVIGSLTDRFGARKMFTVVLLASVPAVLLVALAGTLGSFALLIASGTYLASPAPSSRSGCPSPAPGTSRADAVLPTACSAWA
ncbi:hypothetical protein [Arthrobacter sp. JCM 19049]|uniref:hypothetical protein n=1 Tax=Arthrobacter sp. JCM 19049 TaxID=1460643 RepID=UPI0006D03BB1|nr:hypothetical protein [Arthrobacter sp. JCM 19049]